MRRIITVFLLLSLFAAAGFCQVDTPADDKPIILGISVTGTADSYKFGEIIYLHRITKYSLKYSYYSLDPSLVLTYKRHSFGLGPRIFFIDRYTREGAHKAWGAQLFYHYAFRKPEKAFNYFAFYNLSYARTATHNEGYWAYDQYPGVHMIFNTHTDHINNEIGLGVRYTFLERFYATTSLSAGIHLFRYYRSESSPDLPDDPYLNYTEHGNFLNYGEPTGFFRVGVGYNFVRLKKGDKTSVHSGGAGGRHKG
jgi:hypothetical protein